MGEKREKQIFFFIYNIIWLCNLYFFYWDICKNRNWNVGWVVKHDSKIEKIVFEDVKYVCFYIPIASAFINHLIVSTYKKKENKTHYTTW